MEYPALFFSRMNAVGWQRLTTLTSKNQFF